MDLDDELEMLQRELMAVQQQKTNPLSERTVAEIMVKLYHSGFAFIPTTDGNEYLTPERLDDEIASLIKERGKIGLSILPQLLNVGPDILEARLNPLMQRHPVTRHGPNLFSQRYFDGMVSGLAQKLEQQGRVDLQAVAVDNEMKLQFVEKIIKANLHKLSAELSGNQLITREYTLLKKAKVLGFLSAINNPLQLQVLYKVVGSEAKSAESLALELIEEGRLKGKLQNGYYIPQRFTANQKKVINQLLDSNGYIDLEMLQKKLLVARPEEWISKNLGDHFVKIDKVYFKEAKLESLAAQINSYLKTEGFLELSHVLPISFGEKYLHQFLEGRCGLKQYFICEDFCYSNDWLERLAAEFKHKIVHSIFFKKPEVKGKDSKKKGKKEKVELVNQQELQQVLFNGGYADYSGAQTLAPELLPLLLQRLEDLKKKIQKELAHSKGLITTAFLKYKSSKTIFRTEESLARTVNIIQKQLKKTEKWVDADFGPNEADPIGQYSLLYYDNIVPKGWPSLETLKWEEVKPSQLLSIGKQVHNKNCPMRKCHFVTLLQLIEVHNKRGKDIINTPQIQPLTEDSSLPFVYRFFLNEKQKRWVLVDNLIPFAQGSNFANLGRYSYAEKAYAKLRYCYKGITNVGIQQMLMQITGRNNTKYNGDTEKEREILFQKMQDHLKREDFIVVMAQGQIDKKIIFEDRESQFLALHPYYVYGNAEAVVLQPTGAILPLKQVLQMFRNLIVIERLGQLE